MKERVQTVLTAIAPPEWFVEYARAEATNSPCQSKRGVVIWNAEKDCLVSLGHNRLPPGFTCHGEDLCRQSCSREAVHAEQWALLKPSHSSVIGCTMLHVKVVDKAIVPSGPPSCVQCSKLALAAGISFFWLYHADGWKRYEMLDFHEQSIANSK